MQILFLAPLLSLLLGGVGLAAMDDCRDVLQAGAAGDGLVDDTTAIQAVLNLAAQTGGTVYLPPGQYLIAGSLAIPTGVTLRGSWNGPHHAVWDRNTLLLATRGRGTETGPALLEMQPSSCVQGLTIYYPEQDPAQITPYPWTIHGVGMHTTIENITLANSYNGIAIGPEWNELHLIRNVYGCPLRRGILIDMTTDIGRLENVHFNLHYWARANHPQGPQGEDALQDYRQFMQDNLEAFIFGRTDWESVLNTFAYGAHATYVFRDMGQGAMNGSLTGIGADGCIYGMLVEAIQPMGLVVTNGQFAAFRHPNMPAPAQPSDPPASNICTTDGFAGNLSLVNCSFWGGNPAGSLRGKSSGTARFSGCHFSDWNVYRPQAPNLDVNGPDLQITGCNFATDAKDIMLGPQTSSAIITGNLVRGSLEIISSASTTVVQSDNLER